MENGSHHHTGERQKKKKNPKQINKQKIKHLLNAERCSYQNLIHTCIL